MAPGGARRPLQLPSVVDGSAPRACAAVQLDAAPAARPAVSAAGSPLPEPHRKVQFDTTQGAAAGANSPVEVALVPEPMAPPVPEAAPKEGIAQPRVAAESGGDAHAPTPKAKAVPPELGAALQLGATPCAEGVGGAVRRCRGVGVAFRWHAQVAIGAE